MRRVSRLYHTGGDSRGGFAVGWAQPLVTEDTEKGRELSATFTLPTLHP